MLILLLLNIFIVSADNDSLFFVSGLYANLSPVPNTMAKCNYGDSSCYKIICNMLNDGNLYISYVALSPASSNKLICYNLPKSTNTNMLVMGYNITERFVKPIVCNNIADCLTLGCQLCNDSNYYLIMFLFAGQCLYR